MNNLNHVILKGVDVEVMKVIQLASDWTFSFKHR